MKVTSSNFLSLKNVSYFVQRNRIDLFEEIALEILMLKFIQIFQ